MTTTLSSNTAEEASYAWAEHLIWMEGGEPISAAEKESVWPGLITIVALAGVALTCGWLVSQAGWAQARLLDPIVVSMILGLLVGNLVGGAHWLPGVSVAVRWFLPLGILLLGARMDFFEALRIGVPGLGLSVGVVAMSLLLLLWIGKILGLDRKMAILLGVGTGICGGTAIVALAPLIRAREKDVFVAVGLVTLIGLGMMLFLPFLVRSFALTEVQSGLLAGLVIHQTPQAIASGFAIGESAGEVATVAKLSRVCLLVPMALFLGWWISRGEEEGKSVKRSWLRLIPWFAVGFFLVALARTIGLFPEVALEWEAAGIEFESADLLKSISVFCLAVGMVAVGFQTRFSQARSVGFRPFLSAFCGSLIITVVAVAVIWSFFPFEI
ncbi:MAG: putative sulfate exporter family transporter [Verrucomicrobiota bacterium]